MCNMLSAQYVVSISQYFRQCVHFAMGSASPGNAFQFTRIAQNIFLKKKSLRCNIEKIPHWLGVHLMQTSYFRKVQHYTTI